MSAKSSSRMLASSIMVNGKKQSVGLPMSLTDLLTQLGYQQGAYAVAVNEHFVPRGQYDDTHILDGDRIEIVAPMQGG